MRRAEGVVDVDVAERRQLLLDLPSGSASVMLVRTVPSTDTGW